MAHESDEWPLFSGLVVSDLEKPRTSRILRYSLIGHILVATALILVPIFWPSELPEPDRSVHVVLYEPPPPPPAPLPKGSPLVKKSEPVKPTTPDPKPDRDTFTASDDRPNEAELKPENKTPESEQAGVADGSDLGTPDGMEGGVEGGEIGGVPGGVLGGVIGGMGDGSGWDKLPRIIRQPRPVYPTEAAISRIEGTVEVEIAIGVDGRVLAVWVTKSVRGLDAAAIENVRQWLFTPAIKDGKPTPIRVFGEVRFRLL